MNKMTPTLLIALSIAIIILFITILGGTPVAGQEQLNATTTMANIETTTTIMITTTASTTATKPASIAQQVWDIMKAKGWSDEICAGIMGNMMAECGGYTLNLQPYIVGDGGSSFGLCQWNKKRKTNLLNFNNQNYDTRNNPPSLQHQIDFLEYELELYNIDLTKCHTYQDVAYKFCLEFEIPADKYQKAEHRKQLAAIAYQEFAI